MEYNESGPISMGKDTDALRTLLPKIYLLLMGAMTALGVLGQTLTLLFGYDPTRGVYRLDDPLGPTVAVVLGVFSLILMSAAFSLRREETLRPVPPVGNGVALLSAMSGGALLCTSVLMTVDAWADDGALKIFSLVMVLLALPAGAYFLLTAMSRREEDNRLAVLGFFPVLWLAACLMRIYFDRTSAINDPMQLLLQLSLAAVMLACLTELRALVGKTGFRVRFAISAVAVLLGITSSVSMLVLYFSSLSLPVADGGAIRAVMPRGELLLAVTELLLALYLTGRLIGAAKVPEEADAEPTL